MEKVGKVLSVPICKHMVDRKCMLSSKQLQFNPYNILREREKTKNECALVSHGIPHATTWFKSEGLPVCAQHHFFAGPSCGGLRLPLSRAPPALRSPNSAILEHELDNSSSTIVFQRRCLHSFKRYYLEIVHWLVRLLRLRPDFLFRGQRYLEMAYLFVYSFELGLRFFAHGADCLTSGWVTRVGRLAKGRRGRSANPCCD